MDGWDQGDGRASGLDAADLGRLFDQHHERIWRFLFHRGGRDCADDLAGEVFATAYAARHRFDPARGEPSAWLHGIAANLARAWLRRRGRATRATARLTSLAIVDATATGTADVDRVDDRLSGTADARRVLDALHRLPDADQEVLVLCAWQDLAYDEIADVLGVPVGTVRSRLSRARARLRELAGPVGQVGDESRAQEPR